VNSAQHQVASLAAVISVLPRSPEVARATPAGDSFEPEIVLEVAIAVVTAAVPFRRMDRFRLPADPGPPPAPQLSGAPVASPPACPAEVFAAR